MNILHTSSKGNEHITYPIKGRWAYYIPQQGDMSILIPHHGAMNILHTLTRGYEHITYLRIINLDAFRCRILSRALIIASASAVKIEDALCNLLEIVSDGNTVAKATALSSRDPICQLSHITRMLHNHWFAVCCCLWCAWCWLCAFVDNVVLCIFSLILVSYLSQMVHTHLKKKQGFFLSDFKTYY